jgi:hypothetical protein
MRTYDPAAFTRNKESLPNAQTTGFVCPICQKELALEIPLRTWEVMGSNNAFGHLYNNALPWGLVFGRYIPWSGTDFLIEPLPKYLPVAEVQSSYTPMHSKCYRAKRQEWVQNNQAACKHERCASYHTLCPDCRMRM